MMTESVRSTVERNVFRVAGGIAAGFVARHAIGVARSSEMISMSMPQRLSVIAAATTAGLGYGPGVRTRMQRQQQHQDAADAADSAQNMGVDVAFFVWVGVVMSLHGVVPLPQSTAAWKLPTAAVVGALPAAAIGCTTTMLVHYDIMSKLADKRTLATNEKNWELSFRRGVVSGALAAWPFAAQRVAVWMEVPALVGSTWTAHLHNAAVLGIGPLAGLVIGGQAWMAAKAAQHTEWEERDLNRLEWACIGVTTAVTLWCLRRGLGANVPPAPEPIRLSAFLMVMGGARIGDLLYTQWVNYRTGAPRRGRH